MRSVHRRSRIEFAGSVAARYTTMWWNLIRADNLYAGTVPGILIALSVGYCYNLSWISSAKVAAESFVLFFLYMLSSVVSNQLAATEEDALNKPYRPIVTGELSRTAARRLLAVVWMAYLLVSWGFHTVQWAAVWVTLIILHDYFRLARFWAFKSFAISVGAICMWMQAWRLVAPVDANTWRWSLVLSISVFLLLPIQDLRDIDGDRAVGRRTLPIVLGEAGTRAYLSVGLILLPVVLYWLLLRPYGPTAGGIICGAVIFAINSVTAARLLLWRNRRSDHISYLLFCLWYNVMAGLAGFVIGHY